MERNPPLADVPAELKRRVQDGLDRIGAPSPPGAAAQLAQLSLLVASWGRQINLSGHRSPEAICDRLVLDAAALLSVLPAFESLADLGSGAGFPGLPIAILRPRSLVVLVDSRQRRHHFQRAVVRALALENARPLLGRIEDLEPVTCDIALAQAVGPAAAVADLARAWARDTGWIAIPASERARTPVLRPAGTDGLRELRYQVPGGPERKVWLVPVGSAD